MALFVRVGQREKELTPATLQEAHMSILLEASSALVIIVRAR
jgi:hypothetical protein